MDFQLHNLYSLLKGYSNTCIDVGSIGKGCGGFAPRRGVGGTSTSVFSHLSSNFCSHRDFMPKMPKITFPPYQETVHVRWCITTCESTVKGHDQGHTFSFTLRLQHNLYQVPPIITQQLAVELDAHIAK